MTYKEEQRYLFSVDELEDIAFKCQHWECPYKGCCWHQLSLDELERYEYVKNNEDIAANFPVTLGDVVICRMYLDR